MEIVGTVLSVTQTLLAALQNPKVKEIVSIYNYKSELEELQRTVSIIQAVFQDAEKKQTLSALEQIMIEDLKDAVYEADDLLDEFVTLSEQMQLLEANGNISKKIGNFISRTNPFGVAYKMSKDVKKIRKKLDAIVGNNRFSIVHNPEPIRVRSRETCSYMNEVDIIGRGEDLEKIVGMLLDHTVQQDLSYLSIVGIGGMGKTALAQLVFNDPRVTSVFPLRFWACVSDQDQKHLDVKEILGKILASVKLNEGTTLVEKQTKLQQVLCGKRYLIVLDDVWTENCKEWRDLTQYFVGGQRGSWIVVTTRSQETARIVGGKAGSMHELKGLSEVDSLRLFNRIAFDLEELNRPIDDDLIELGRDIVDGCVCVPLAIRVVGSLLYGQEKSKWQLFKEIGLANIRKSEDGIMFILQLSYHHLESPLKSCFKYCALFPKDYDIKKVTLIDLWIAQDYVVPFRKGQSVEYAAEEYYSILLKRCFFQDVCRDELGDIVSCKMHDLIHDVAQSVSGKEIFAANIETTHLDKEVRHFSIPVKKSKKPSLDNTHVRSCVYIGDYRNQIQMEHSFVVTLISSCRYLRVLHLDELKARSLPNSLSMLSHLRYLDLSNNGDLEVLPKSISKLYNLQTLKLNSCVKLQKLPHNFFKLIKLRVLDIAFCNKLRYMPRGVEKLSCLKRLSDFIVGGEGNFENWKEWFNGVEGLKALNELQGKLRVNIKWPKNVENVVTGDYIEKGSVLSSKNNLTHIVISFEREEYGRIRMDEEEMIGLMKDLHPPPHLKILVIWNYKGTRMPDWGSLLPNLERLEIQRCSYLEEWGRRRVVSNSGNNQVEQLPCLPRLKSLSIDNCRQLTLIPMCPKLELLHLKGFNERLVIGEVGHASSSSSTSTQEVANLGVPKFKKITISKVSWLNLLPMEAFQCLETLKIISDYVEKLGEVGEMLRSCSSSLRRLEILWCDKVRSVVGGGLEHLTALEELHLYSCENLKLEEENQHQDVGIMPCPSLRSLKLFLLPKLEYLPNWMQYLTALQTLSIGSCEELKVMPNWMPTLTSLRHLQVDDCSESLERRCQEEPQGEDWPLIQHIPSITFKDSRQL